MRASTVAAAFGVLPPITTDPRLITAVLVTLDSESRVHREVLNRDGRLVAAGTYRFAQDVVPVQAMDGRLLLAVPHYPPPRPCGGGSCAFQAPTFSLDVVRGDGAGTVSVPNSLGQCEASLIPGSPDVVAAFPVVDHLGHGLVEIRILGRNGHVRTLLQFDPEGGGFCSGSLAVTPDRSAVYVATGARGGTLRRVPLAHGAVSTVGAGSYSRAVVGTAVSGDGLSLALSAVTYPPVHNDFQASLFHIAVMPVGGGVVTAVATKMTTLTKPVWITSSLLGVTAIEPEYAIYLIEAATGAATPLLKRARLLGAL